MKKSNFIEGLLFVFGGAILLCIALFTDSVLESLFAGLGVGAMGSGLVMTCKYIYWSGEKNRERYRQKIEKENIEIHDELKSMLRDKSGRYSYTIGIVTVGISMMIFYLLGKLEIMANTRVLVLYLGGYLIFQIMVQIVIYRCLLKKYE